MVLLSLLFIACNSLFSLSDMLIAELGAQVAQRNNLCTRVALPSANSRANM